MRHALVMVMRDEIEYVLFEVGARATNRMHFVLADHLGQRKAKFRRAHRAGDGHEHDAALIEMAHVAFRGILHGRRVEVTKVFVDELTDRFSCSFCAPRKDWIVRQTKKNHPWAATGFQGPAIAATSGLLRNRLVIFADYSSKIPQKGADQTTAVKMA